MTHWDPLGVWFVFLASAAALVIAATKLADYGDVIAVRTKLGGMLIGTVLLAGATSLPELLTAVNSIREGVPNLTVGDLFGSCMFNMLLLAVLDLILQETRILRRVAVSHAISASLAVLLLALAMFFILTNIPFQIGWVGLDSLILMGAYAFGLWLIRVSPTVRSAASAEAGHMPTEAEPVPSLTRALVGFGISSAVLIVVTPWMVRSAVAIAEITGLTAGVVGIIMVALVTSLPELVTTGSAVRSGAFDLAVGNLFGSNVLNMLVLGVVDLFYLEGRLIGQISPTMMVAGMLALMLTALGGLGNLARVERRVLFLEIDALLIIVVYGLGIWLLIARRLIV